MLVKLNVKYHIIFFTNTIYCYTTLHHFCITVSFTSPNETRKERDIIKLIGQNITGCVLQTLCNYIVTVSTIAGLIVLVASILNTSLGNLT
jgi:hypothetical protein